MKLVVIEAPAKRETLKKYLGSGYEVFATKGHIRDLPVKSFAIDMNNNYEPHYENKPDKKELISELKNKAGKAEEVLIATDPDREGEAISWHIANVLGLDPNTKCRIQFNEISKNAVLKALKSPRAIDLNLVNAQQARRVMDRIVGYKLSPIISKKVAPKLSAGRVQSVALKLVVDREKEIESFVPEEYWTVTAQHEKDKISFKSTLQAHKNKKIKISNKEEVEKVLGEIKGKDFIVSQIKKTKTKSHAPAPFTTSTMQQDALNKAGMSLKRTTESAQQLYEGVEVKGEGKIALITYIRTDSTRVSEDAQKACREFIKEKYGEKFLPAKPNIYASKQSAQDAHEAIRPITLERTPESVKDSLSSDNYRLYKLIYERFLASQMSEAEYNTVNAEISAGDYTFKVSGKTPLFPGYTAVYSSYQEEKDDDMGVKLPELTVGEQLEFVSYKYEQKFTKPPARYTEASLVKTMEEKGIGRPATYTPTVALLFSRQYIEKEGKFITPTKLGEEVTDMLIKYFPDFMDVGFTANMENKLDEIEEGGKKGDRESPDLIPTRAAEVSEGPVDDGGDFHVVRKILNDRRAAGEHRAHGNARQNHGGRRNARQKRERQHYCAACNAEHKRAHGDDDRRGNRNRRAEVSVGTHAGVEKDNGQSCTEGGALAHTQRRGRSERISQNVLHHGARQGKTRSHDGSRGNSRQTNVVEDHFGCFGGFMGEHTDRQQRIESLSAYAQRQIKDQSKNCAKGNGTNTLDHAAPTTQFPQRVV